MTAVETAEELAASLADQAVVASHVEKVIRTNYGTAGMDDSLSLEELISANQLDAAEIVALVAAGVESYRDYALGYVETAAREQGERAAERQRLSEEFEERLKAIASDIELPEAFTLVVARDAESGAADGGRLYFQIQCWRMDTFTKEMGWGYGGKAYLSPHAVDSELVGTAFGLYKSYVEHEARETFKWRERRIYGPHIDIVALREVARRVSFRKPPEPGE